jgi:Ca2+-binding EF-hand superfamily protein
MLKAGFRLTDGELSLLANAYRSPRRAGAVQWRRFADEVMAFVAPKTLEHTPTLVPLRQPELLARTIAERSQREEPPPDIARILGVVNKFVVARRISLTEQFVDKDPHNHKQVAPSAFAQVLQLMGIYLSKGQIDSLTSFYLDRDTKFVRYPDFVADIGELGGVDFGENAGTKLVVNPRPEYAIDIGKYVASCPKISADQLQWTPLLKRIQSFVLKRRLRIVEFFENFDRLRHGTVTVQKFRSVVGQLDLPLSEDDIQFTTKLFALESHPDLVNYKLLCQQVDDIFGVTDLHRTPARDATCRASYLPDPSLRLSDVQGPKKDKVDQVVARLQKLVATRRVEVKQQFEDYDRAPHRNYVTKAQFKQCVGRLGFFLNDEELELLCERYKCTDLDETNYKAFCDDIQALCDWTWPLPREE